MPNIFDRTKNGVNNTLPTPVTIDDAGGSRFPIVRQRFVRGPNLEDSYKFSATSYITGDKDVKEADNISNLDSPDDLKIFPKDVMNVDSLIINNQDLPFNRKDFAKSNVLQSTVLRAPVVDVVRSVVQNMPSTSSDMARLRFLPPDPNAFESCSFASGQTYIDPNRRGQEWPGMTTIERSFVMAKEHAKEKPKTTIYGVHRKKHVPARKTEDELYDDIEPGPHFEQYISSADVHISGGDDEETIYMFQTFEECKFPSIMLKNIFTMGYRVPTPIQRAVMKIFLLKPKNDIIAQAQTGSGKSAAYLLPLISEIHKLKILRGEGLNRDSPYAIIISPTRELTLQLYENARAFSNGTCVIPARCFGSFAFKENRAEIHAGCDILFCTTGRLKAFISDQTINLRKVMFFVLDEADDLIKQKDELETDVKLLKDLMSPGHRTLLFSATFDTDAQKVAETFVRTGYYFVSVGIMNAAVDSVEHCFIPTRKTDKIDVLFDLLKNDASQVMRGNRIIYKVPKTVVFVNRKKLADKVAIALTIKGIKAWSMNSDRPQALREEALNALMHDEESNVIVSTDLLSRGHNIKNLHHVVNFDLPDTIIKYIHRIGRTGRIGNTGLATSLFNLESENDIKLAPYIIKIMETAKKEPPSFLIELVDRMEKNYQETMAFCQSEENNK